MGYNVPPPPPQFIEPLNSMSVNVWRCGCCGAPGQLGMNCQYCGTGALIVDKSISPLQNILKVLKQPESDTR